MKRKQQHYITKIVKDVFKTLQECFCCCCSCLYYCGCCPCIYFLASPPPSPEMQPLEQCEAYRMTTGVTTNPLVLNLFSRKASNTETVLDHVYLLYFVEEALAFVEELSRNTTYETDELQDILTLISSVCSEDKKQTLKV